MTKKLTPYQAHMRRSLKGKMKGKTKSQRKAIFKAAAKSWKKVSKSPRVSGSTPKKAGTKSTSKGGTRRVGKRGPNLVNLFFKALSIGALVAPTAMIATSSATPQNKLKSWIGEHSGWSPYDGTFKFERLIKTYTPYVVTTILGAVIPRIGSIIRRLLK